MPRWKTKRPGEFGAGTDTLSRLLDREHHLALQLEVAKAEAGRVVDEAREYARQAEAACETLIEERTASLVVSHDQQLRDELQRIELEAEREASRFADSDPARMERLVTLVLDAIVVTGPKAGSVG